MSDPYIGEIRLFGFNFAPQGWSFCAGQLLAIQTNQALFAVIGTTYGGDGVTTFALPNLQSRVMIGQGTSTLGTSYTMGEISGSESVNLTISNMPQHRHAVETFSTPGTTSQTNGAAYSAVNPTGKVSTMTPALYATEGTLVPLQSELRLTGGSIPHDNMQPYLVANYCIALLGIFPSRN